MSDLGSAEKAAKQGLALDRRMAASMYLKLAARYRGIIDEGGEPARPLRHYGHDRAAMEAVFENLRQGLGRRSNERLLGAYDVLDF